MYMMNQGAQGTEYDQGFNQPRYGGQTDVNTQRGLRRRDPQSEPANAGFGGQQTRGFRQWEEQSRDLQVRAIQFHFFHGLLIPLTINQSINQILIPYVNSILSVRFDFE